MYWLSAEFHFRPHSSNIIAILQEDKIKIHEVNKKTLVVQKKV